MSTIAKLLLLFTLIPIAEISLLIPLHSLVGDWPTFGIICVTAILGTILTKWQGGAAFGRIKEAISEGRLPGEEIIDGVLVLLAGATLITPGVLTDTVGLLLLLPTLRAPITRYAKKRIMSWIDGKSTSAGVGPRPQHEAPPRNTDPLPLDEVVDGGSLGQPDDLL